MGVRRVLRQVADRFETWSDEDAIQALKFALGAEWPSEIVYLF